MPFTSENAHTGTQFKPGQSGNPAGKPKGTKHINTWVQELLEDENFEMWLDDPREGVKLFKGAPIKAILQAQARIALSSRDESVRIKATDLLFKHGYAKKSETDITTNGENVNTVDANLLTQFLQSAQENTKR